MSAAVAYARELREGWSTTRLLLALRWRMVRSRRTRMLLIAGALFVGFGMLMAINLGYAVQVAAMQGDTTQGIYAQIWVSSLMYGTMSSIGAFAVGGAVVVAFFAPFTGTTTLALVPVEDLEAVRPTRAHRYFDALVINCVSGIGILQLLTLTGVTSLLTLDGQRLPAEVITWAVWGLLVVLTTTVGWVLEWVVRRFGKTRRRILGAVLGSMLGVVLLLDPDHGSTLFGAAAWYTTMLRSGLQGWTATLLAVLAVTVLITVLVMLAGVAASRWALSLPAPAGVAARARRAAPLGTNPTAIAVRLFTRVVWRTLECRRPLASILVFGVPAMLLVGIDGNVEVAMTLAVPLAVALAWGVNVFGVLGTGMTWLASQPALIRRLPLVTTGLQYAATVGLLGLLWLLSYLGGHSTPETGQRVLIEATVGGLAVAAYCMRLSIEHPVRTRLSGRGDALVPPITALSYLLRLMLLAVAPAVVLSLPVSGTDVARFCAVMVTGSLLLTAWSQHRWNDPTVRSRVVHVVSTA